MMSDEFSGYGKGLTSPMDNFAAVVPSDTADLADVSRALIAATNGIVRFTGKGMADGESVEVYVTAGVPFPARVKRIWATNTTATGIVVGW